MNYPVNCKHCGQLIFGPVKFCPFCSAVQLIEVKPPEVKVKPPEVKVKPPEVKVKLPEVKVKPPEVKVKPPEVEVKPPEVEVKPPEVEVKPPEAFDKSRLTDDTGGETQPLPAGKMPVGIYVVAVAALIIGIIFVRTFFSGSGAKPSETQQVNQTGQPIQQPVNEQQLLEQRRRQQDSISALHKQQAQQNVLALINKGMEYYQNGQYQLSIKQMNAVLQLDPNNQVALKNIDMARRAEQEIRDDINAGIAFYHQGKFQLAIEKMREVLRKDANNPTAVEYIEKSRSALSAVYEKMRNPDVGQSF